MVYMRMDFKYILSFSFNSARKGFVVLDNIYMDEAGVHVSHCIPIDWDR